MMPSPQFARRMERLRPSPIREILKVIDRPGMISFAGGLPSPDTFPELDLQISASYLQYGASEGETELREKIASDMCAKGLECDAEQVLILSGSQQGIDLVAKMFIEQGTEVAVEYPTYLAALQVFSLYNPVYVNLDELSVRSRLAYAIPTFQNPTGHCYSRSERQRLAERCDHSNTVLYEDDPYGDLFYDDVCRVPVCSFLSNSSWIYQGSFSKTFCPGLRLGYMVCSKELIPFLTPLKQAADLHSNRVSQVLVHRMLTAPGFPARLSALQDQYRRKRDFFETRLAKYFGDFATWTKPSGGLFFWVILKQEQGFDLEALFRTAISNNVAFMPGDHFYPTAGMRQPAMRFNFSHASEDQADRGLKRLADLITEC